jgi:hypothetical protein
LIISPPRQEKFSGKKIVVLKILATFHTSQHMSISNISV